MVIHLHPHAMERLVERGATEEEVKTTVKTGERFPARFGRTRFRKSFRFESTWQKNFYSTKEVEAIAIAEGDDWLVITVVTRYY
jgi:hypothetical protein